MTCNKCGKQIADNSAFCPNCGERAGTPNGAPQPQPQQPTQNGSYGTFEYQIPYRDPYNHTAEFDQNDISNNKVFAMLPYLMGTIGVIIAMLAGIVASTVSGKSSYVSFHVRQSLKISVINILLGIIAIIFFWTFIIPIFCAVCFVIMFVIRIIGFFSVCLGNAKELPIIRNLGFLN